MNHMNGRAQDSITGRFLSADPHIPNPTNTQDYNRYSYADNNPLTLVDPTGFDAKPCEREGCAGDAATTIEQMEGFSCYGNCGGGWANTMITTAPNPAYVAALNNLAAAINNQINGVNNLIAAINNNPLSDFSGGQGDASGGTDYTSLAEGLSPAGVPTSQYTMTPSYETAILYTLTRWAADKAWSDSYTGDPVAEQGYMVSADGLVGTIAVGPAPSVLDARTGDFSNMLFSTNNVPPVTEQDPQWTQVLTFHTHPFDGTGTNLLTGEPFTYAPEGPSSLDLEGAYILNAPGVVRAPGGTYFYGPRSGSLCSTNPATPGC